MNKYIDAEKLIAEIEKFLAKAKNDEEKAFAKKDAAGHLAAVTKTAVCVKIKKLIATLQQEQPEADLAIAVRNVTKDKESATRFLKSAGIMDENGELAEMYRSEELEKVPLSMEITDETEWADVDSFIHKNVSGGCIIQIYDKQKALPAISLNLDFTQKRRNKHEREI